MNREFREVNKSVITYRDHLLTRVDSAESLRRKLVEEENYTMTFRNIEVGLIQDGHVTPGVMMTFYDEESNAVYLVHSDLLGTFISDII